MFCFLPFCFVSTSSNQFCKYQCFHVFNPLTSSCLCAFTVSRLWGGERLSIHRRIITSCCSSDEQKHPKNISNHLFSIVFVFYGGSFLSNMSGRKHLRCSLGLLAPPAQTIWQNSGTEITPKLGHFWVKAVCLFVFLLTLTNPDHLSELWQAAKIESLSSDHTHPLSFIHFQNQKWKQILFLV